MFERLSNAARAALRPVRMLNPIPIKNALKHPSQTRALLSDREIYIVYITSNDTEIIGAIRFSNIVFVPELAKGWIILPETAHIYNGKPLYLCDPAIPYTLGIRPSDYDKNLNDELTPELQLELGLPKNVLRLHSDALGQLCMSKWNTSFDEAGGSIMIFLFGAAVGAVLIVLLLSSLLALGGVFG